MKSDSQPAPSPALVSCSVGRTLSRSVRPPRWTAALAVSVLLVACPQPPEPPVSGLRDQAVTFGLGLSVPVQQAYTGEWQIQGLPSWLKAVPESGSGNLNTVLYAHRSVATPTTAAQPTLTGTVAVAWKNEDGKAAGKATLNVSADLYRLTGRVQDSVTSLGLQTADLQPNKAGAAVRAPSTTAPRNVIVSYRSQAARIQAVQALQSAAGKTEAAGERLRSAVGKVVTLSTPDVQRTIAQLQMQPEVEFAVPDAILSAQDMTAPAPSASPGALPVAAQGLAAQQLLSLPLNPSDQYAPLQWAYRQLGYPAVWRDMQLHPYTKAVTVAVLDTGVRYDHPDLKGQLYGPGEGALDVLTVSRDAKGQITYNNGDGDGPDTDPTDPSTPNRSDISHGTHVTGIIAANWGSYAPPCPECSGSGVVGATYTAAVRVLPVRVLDAPGGDGNESEIALAIQYAAGDTVTLSDGKNYVNPHPAQVINLSLGGVINPNSEVGAAQIKVLCDAVARASTLGALVVASAGNRGSTSPNYPAACPGAVAVASVSLSDSPVPAHAYYSDQYQQVALSAPGGQPGTFFNGGLLNGSPAPDEILSTGWNYAQNLPGYYLEAGTSQAAPQVTALAALLLSKGVVATPAAALDRILATASDLGVAGRDAAYGVGLINPAAALGAAAVSNTLGLSVQDKDGRAYAPLLDSVGRFTAYLPDGPMRVVAGRDSNGNGFAGETNEPRAEKSVIFGPSLSAFDVGTLTP